MLNDNLKELNSNLKEVRDLAKDIREDQLEKLKILGNLTQEQEQELYDIRTDRGLCVECGLQADPDSPRNMCTQDDLEAQMELRELYN